MNSDEANERQIFIAADLYKDKPIILEKVLIRLLKLLSNGKCTGIDRALEIVFQALRKYEKEKKIQIAGRWVNHPINFDVVKCWYSSGGTWALGGRL